MKNTFIKILTILTIIFISFFIKEDKVAAETCRWISPLSFINENGLPSKILSHVEYEDGSGIFGPDALSIKALTSYRLKYDGSNYKIGYSVEKLNPTPKGNPTLNSEGGYNIWLDGSYGGLGYDAKPNGNCSSYKYVKATVSYSGGAFYITINGVSKDEYVSYLSNGGQYKNLFPSGNLYGQYNIYAYTTKNDFSEIKDQDYSGEHTITFYNMIDATGGTIYFVNMSESEAYPTDNFSSFQEMMNIAEINGTRLTDEEKTKALSGLGTIIDTSSNNTITYTKAFYDGTKTKWLTYMNQTTNGNAETTRREFFSKWFNKSIARYVFEDDLDTFLRYFEFIYDDDCGTNVCDLDGDGDNDSSDVRIYNNIITIIESMTTYTEGSSQQSQIQSDPCISVCAQYISNSNALIQCQNGETYRNCRTSCAQCENIGSSTAQEQCYDTCTNGSYSSASEEISQAQQEAANAAAIAGISIYSVSTPTLDIDFNNYASLSCEDVEVFHIIYVIIRIAAPVAVILFGSLDYAKAVMSSDIEKMEKSKKKFPKRILALILFILIPTIIGIILTIYSKNGGENVNSNLMWCIVKGS